MSVVEMSVVEKSVVEMSDLVVEKTCSKCTETKDALLFLKDRNVCRKCTNKINNEKYKIKLIMKNTK
jgi:formylmethanofuran dehydrogenase subunit E